MVENPAGKICAVSFGALLICLSFSTSVASYSREQCPPGISHVMEPCACKEYSSGLYVICDLEGRTYERLPVFGYVNNTIAKVILRNGTITEIPRHVFGNLPVSCTCTRSSILHIYTHTQSHHSKWNDKRDSITCYTEDSQTAFMETSRSVLMVFYPFTVRTSIFYTNGQPGRKTRPHARLPPSFLGLDARVTSQLNVAWLAS